VTKPYGSSISRVWISGFERGCNGSEFRVDRSALPIMERRCLTLSPGLPTVIPSHRLNLNVCWSACHIPHTLQGQSTVCLSVCNTSPNASQLHILARPVEIESKGLWQWYAIQLHYPPSHLNLRYTAFRRLDSASVFRWKLQVHHLDVCEGSILWPTLFFMSALFMQVF
jgi:hypothetical protein